MAPFSVNLGYFLAALICVMMFLAVQATHPTFANIDPYSIVGCFPSGSLEPGILIEYPSDDLSASECLGGCAENAAPNGDEAFQYAGLHNGTDCFCGTYLADSAQDPVESCMVPCPGNSTQACGGNNDLLVYQNNGAPPGDPSNKMSPGTTTSMFAYSPILFRAISTETPSSPSMSGSSKEIFTSPSSNPPISSSSEPIPTNLSSIPSMLTSTEAISLTMLSVSPLSSNTPPMSSMSIFIVPSVSSVMLTTFSSTVFSTLATDSSSLDSRTTNPISSSSQISSTTSTPNISTRSSTFVSTALPSPTNFTAAPANTSGHSKSHVGMWVGLAFGILVFVLLIFGLVFFWKRRHTRQRASSISQHPSSFDIAETNSPGISTTPTNRTGVFGEENFFMAGRTLTDVEIAETGRKRRETLEAWKRGYVPGGPDDPESPRREAEERAAKAQRLARNEDEKLEFEDTPVIKNDRRATLTEEDGKRNRERFEAFKKGHRSVSMLNFSNLVLNEESQTFEDRGRALSEDESRQSMPVRGNFSSGLEFCRENSTRNLTVPGTMGVPDAVGGTGYLHRGSSQLSTPSMMSGTLGDMSYLRMDPGMEFYSQSPDGRGPNRVSELDGDPSPLKFESTPSMAAPAPVNPLASRQTNLVETEGDKFFDSPPRSNTVQALEAAANNHQENLKPANPDCDSE